MILFIVFNVGDLVGKLAPLFKWQPPQALLLGVCLSRVVFFPAFFCAARFAAPDWVTIVLTVVLGLSNGCGGRGGRGKGGGVEGGDGR